MAKTTTVDKINSVEILHFLDGMKKDVFTDTFPNTLNVTADYTPESLIELEKGIYRTLSKPTLEQPPVMIVLALAFYFGETLIANLPGAHWKEETIYDPTHLKVIVPQPGGGRSEISPVRRMIKFFANSEDGLYTVYKTAKHFVDHSLNLEKAKNNWTHIDDINRFRLRGVFSTPVE